MPIDAVELIIALSSPPKNITKNIGDESCNFLMLEMAYKLCQKLKSSEFKPARL